MLCLFSVDETCQTLLGGFHSGSIHAPDRLMEDL